MRRAHSSGDDADAKARMRRLAADFPGALRELDRLPMVTIDERIATLEAGQRPLWAEVLIAYHGWLRVALRVRRELRGATDDPKRIIEWLRAQARRRPGDPPLAAVDEETIQGFLRPPAGRITRWAIERIARDRGLTPQEVSDVAFDTRNA